MEQFHREIKQLIGVENASSPYKKLRCQGIRLMFQVERLDRLKRKIRGFKIAFSIATSIVFIF